MRFACAAYLLALLGLVAPERSLAQLPSVQPPTDVKPPSQQPTPALPPPNPLPPPSQLLPAPPTLPADSPALSVPIVVERYNVVGSTVFSAAELAKVTAPFTTPATKRPISFTELLQARSAITKLYVDRGYVTSGAILPEQTISNGVVVIQVVEGSLETINITGTRRLRPGYVQSRLGLATQKPLNRDRLLEALQLLQLDPLIQRLSADLQAGTRPGTNILEVNVTEADSFSTAIALDNNRTPSVGSFRRRVSVNEGNLLGFGDGLSLGYTNTDGSNGVDFSYTVPVSPHNTSVSLAIGTTRSNVIERPFDRLDISARSRYYELTVRQPLLQTPNQELAVGASFSHQQSQTFLGLDDIGGFPLSVGADAKGRTRISALRFFQEWNQRSSQQVLAFRSQFSVGVNLFNATVNDRAPDSHFFAWRGQGQWLRSLAPDTLLLVRADVQIADRPLVGLEQFGLGGQASVRGYRQDLLLTDNGVLGSVEVRLPVLRVPQVGGVLQLTPFLDVGRGSNRTGINPNPSTLVGIGAGLLWRQDRFTARLDYGIPLVSQTSRGNTWQEKGLYFSIVYTPF